ncbi:MAG: HRDC domain-containing protein [Bacteroidaceae bacterium]|nr:HRDC domain-containing protein [Bacteroidaceae bacterium]
MQIKILTLPAFNSDAMEEEVNKFLRSHRVMAVDRQFCPDHGGYWTLCVSYQENGGTSGPIVSRASKVDYREVLSPEAFGRFARYREIRKEVASQQGIPAYAVFTDEELAQIAQMEEVSVVAIAAIKGVGKRAEKYGAAFVDLKTE